MAKKGNIPWNKGRTGVYSKETLESMSLSRRTSSSIKKGEKLPPRSEEWCRNISLAKLGCTPWNKGKKGVQIGWNKGIPMRKDSRAKLSKSLQGNIPWNKGTRQWPNGLPKETTDKISKALKGKKHSKEWVKNQLESRRKNGNFVMSQVQKDLISKSNTGRKHPRSKEYCELQSLVQSKYWESDAGKKRKDQMSKERKNIPRPPHVAEILRNNIRSQVFPIKNTKPELMMQLALKLNGIEFILQKVITDKKDFWHRVDIFIEPNICVEVDGDHHHANPIKYMKDQIMWKKPKIRTAADIWARDSYVNHELTVMGYIVIRIWASDIKKNREECANRVIRILRDRLENKII